MTVAQTFPSLAEKLLPDFRNVTLEQLLCHRSGLPEDRAPDLVIWPRIMMLKGDLREQRRSLVELVMGRPPAKPPDSTFAYSNLGFTVAGAMAEAVTGQSYESLIERRLFGPLGMKSGGLACAGRRYRTESAHGHSNVFGMYSSAAPGPGSDNPAVITPAAGCVHCSIKDWAKYAVLHLCAGSFVPPCSRLTHSRSCILMFMTSTTPMAGPLRMLTGQMEVSLLTTEAMAAGTPSSSLSPPTTLRFSSQPTPPMRRPSTPAAMPARPCEIFSSKDRGNHPTNEHSNLRGPRLPWPYTS